MCNYAADVLIHNKTNTSLHAVILYKKWKFAAIK